jgi:hypothetical protein
MTKRKPAKVPRSPEMAARVNAFLGSPELAAAVQGPPPEGYPPKFVHPGYTRIAMDLIAHPERISKPEWRDAIVRILEAYVVSHPPATPSPADTAFLVDMELLLSKPTLSSKPRLSVTEARQRVADGTGKALQTVIENHIEFGRQR